MIPTSRKPLAIPGGPSPARPAGPAADRWDAELGGIAVRFGAGRLPELGDLARELGARRALLVTDPGVLAAGHATPAREALEGAGLGVALFDRVAENPSTGEVEAAAAAFAGQGVDLIVAIGGGSVLDCAKGLNFVLTNGPPMARFRGFHRVEHPLLPSLGVPTTAGTGSEAQAYAVLTDSSSGRKLACGDPEARFRAVILDPLVAATAPAAVAGAAGLDALSHAVESFVSTAANPVSRLLSLAAWRLLEGSLEGLWSGGGPEAAADALLGAHLAGAAIAQSMLGAAHACANPLTARHAVPHGVAVGLMLPAVVRFNAPRARALYRELAEAANLRPADPGEPAAETLARRLRELGRRAGLPSGLARTGIPRAGLPALAGEAAEEWTAGFNPRPVAAEQLLEVYEAAW